MTAVAPRSIRTAGSDALSRVAGMAAATSEQPWAAGHSGTASAIVLSLDGRNAQVECEGQVQAARVAFGCLVRPEPGDRVLIGEAGGMTWIISVLERQSDAPPRLWAEGDIGIVSVTGDISLMASREVQLDAGARVRASAPEIDLHAGIARFVLDELLHVGRRINLHVAKIRSVGEMVETFAEHLLTRARRGTRFIEESDQIRAGDIDFRAEGNLQLQAETAFITADTVVRVDADQIHMG
jgi:Protein of unknown function (DUF3540)